MNLVSTLSELRTARAMLAGPVGLIPTMGYLHEGHLSLVRAAKKECASIVVSIFVNPTQFGPTEDLGSYPRDLQRDLSMLENEGVDLVWHPSSDIMYPDGYQTWINVEQVAAPLEGGMRPGHFCGVATVVAKLFNAVQPDKAYFGQKDAQQAAVIRRMVLDLNFNLEVIICPIQREADGLAMSSRNVYLNPQERKAATVLSRALGAAAAAYQRSVDSKQADQFAKNAHNEMEAEDLRQVMAQMIQSEPLARLQYVSCADPDSMQEIQGPLAPAGEGSRVLLSMAVFIGKTRLIDNLVIGEKKDAAGN